jgi:amino acid adenylation domain-containing protein
VNDHVGQESAGLDSELLRAFESLPADQRDQILMELGRRRALAAPIPRADRSEGLRASCAQEGLWFLEQADPGSVAYVMPASVRLRGPLDVEAVALSLTELARRHEILRTTFTSIDGRPYQVIADPAPVPLPVTDLTELSAGDVAAAVLTWQREEAERPFDIAAEPGLRAQLLVTGSDEQVLMLTMHHIVSDGWSLGVILTELSALYQAFARQQPSPLAELPIQYGDFAQWQLDRVARILDGHLEYWRGYLADAPVLELPVDRSRQAATFAGGGAVPWHLTPPTMSRIGQLAEQAGATPFMVLLAAFAVLLSRWSGQADLVIGYPTAGRVHADLEPLIGYFVNTLPLRADLSGRPSFADLLQQVRADCTAGFEHQEVPFDQIVRELHPDRLAGQVPLIQVMLALRNVPMPELRLGDDLTLESLGYRTVAAKFDLCLDLVPDSHGGLEGRLEYRTGLFDDLTIRRLMGYFDRLIDGLIGDPAGSVATVPMISADEGRRLVSELAQATADGTAASQVQSVPPDQLHGLFESRADADPAALAVLCGDRRLSYWQVEERANVLASRLKDAGVSADDVVGLCLPPSAELVIALLGVLKAGGAYALLDPHSPAERITAMITGARIGIVLTTTAVARLRGLQTRDLGADLRCLDDFELDRVSPAARPAPVTAGRNLASVTFRPQAASWPAGAMNEHDGLTRTACGLRDSLDLKPADRLLVVGPAGAQECPGEIFAALAAGAAVVMPGSADLDDPAQLLDLIRGQDVTVLSSAPAALGALADYVAQLGPTPALGLRVAAAGGGALPPDLPARLTDLSPGLRVVNLAGTAEASYCSTARDVLGSDRLRPSVPWGRPLPGHRLYVLDDRLRPAPVGVPGELYVGGAGPGRGLLGQPSLTARRFVADPYAGGAGGRMYATGDRARLLADGNLEHLGRFDRQLKAHGVRIEPAEIEALLAAHPAVIEAAVASYQDPASGPALAGYLTARIDPPPPTAELREFLATRLPGPMIPAQLSFVDELPRRPDGQIDLRRLPDPLGRGAADGGVYVQPDDSLEQALADLLAGVLEIEQVGALSDFFDLGGHSLQATQAVSRIAEVFRVGLTIPDFLGARTVRQLAGELRNLGLRYGVDVDAIADLVAEISAMPAEVAAKKLAE